MGEPIGQQICSAFADLASPDLPAETVDVLLACAQANDPDEVAGRTRFTRGGDDDPGHESIGLNSTRGAAMWTAGALLQVGHDGVERLGDVLASGAVDPVLGVRMMAARGLRALLGRDSSRALDLAGTLLHEAPEVLASQDAVHLLIARFRSGSDDGEVLQAALQHPPSAPGAGIVWAVVLHDGDLPVEVPQTLGALSDPARVGAAKALVRAVHRVPEVALELFSQDGPNELLEAVARCAGGLVDAPRGEERDELMSAAIASPAFRHQPWPLLHALAEHNGLLPSEALDAVESFMASAGEDVGDIRTGAAGDVREATAILLRFYRQADAPSRERVLDVIDQLVLQRAFGVDERLNEIR